MSGGWSVPESEIEFRFTASGGPGGQHANRSNTKAPSLFVAVDRFIAVAYPHKVTSFSGKSKIIKCVLIVLNILLVIARVSCQFVLNPDSLLLFISNILTLVFICMQLSGCVALYASIVVILMKSAKTIRNASHGLDSRLLF